ncbi:MAG: hypothetical protein FK730_16410 [Asgard group archaeon]|nr:hypothetical protein [Asgard group archaeon]
MFNKTSKIALIIISFLLIPQTTLQMNFNFNIEVNNNPEIIANFETEDQLVGFVEFADFDDDGGYAEAIYIENGIAYVANQNQGLEILNITIPNKPKKLASYKTAGNALEVHVKDGFAYVSQSFYGVAVINIENPSNPYLASTISPGGLVREIDIRDNLLHIITDYSGFFLYDIRDPYYPVYVSHYNSPYLHTGISVLNKYICLATFGFGVEILDLTFTTSPFLIGYWNESFSPTYGVFATIINDQKFAFLASSHNGLEIINFTNPYEPVKIGSFYVSGTFHNVRVKDSIAYCSTFEKGLLLLNISDLSEPVEIATYDTEYLTVDCSLENSTCVIADRFGGVKILDVSDPNNIILQSKFFDHGFAFKILLQDNLAFIADRNGGMEILNISDSIDPQKISQYQRTDFSVIDVTIKDDLAILTEYDQGLEFVNISDITNPVKITSYVSGNYMRTCTIKDDLVFIGSLNKTLEVLDISLFPAISLVGQYTFSMDNPNVYDLLIQDDILIVGFSQGCMLLNISNPSSITEIDSYINSQTIYDIVMDDHLLFCANSANGLEILNMTNNQLTRVSGLDTFGYAHDVLLDNELIYLATQSNGIEVINVSDINNPTDVGGYHLKKSYGLAKKDQYILSCSYEEGIVILALDSDSDTITDKDEIDIWGTDPFNADSDFDEMPDNFEIENNLNPLDDSDAAEDPDEDGLTNLEEYIQFFFYGESTDPFDFDTDNDLMPDGWEVDNHLDPTLANDDIDSDFDYLTNYEEYLFGTDPRDRDTDGDDAEDGLEILYNTDPLNPKDNPIKRRLIRVFITLPVGSIFIGVGIFFFIRNIKKRIARNVEREKRLEEAEDEILLF